MTWPRSYGCDLHPRKYGLTEEPTTQGEILHYNPLSNRELRIRILYFELDPLLSCLWLDTFLDWAIDIHLTSC